MLFNKLSKRIKNKKVAKTCFLVILASGLLLNCFFPHKLFFVNQTILMIMLMVQLAVLKQMNKEREEIKKCIKEKNEPEVFGLLTKKVERIPYTMIGEIISIILVLFYIITMYVVGCLEITITGLYGGLLGGLVFYIGIQAYLNYIALLYFAYDLRHIQIKTYSFYFPALTNWIRKLARELSYIEKWFLILGLMYSIIYAINLPKGSVIITHNISFNSTCNVLLIATWIGILVFFAIAFPVFTFLGRIFIKDVVYSCKCNSINQIESQLSVLSSHSSENLEQIERLIALTKIISESDEYPLKYSQTIFDKAYTIIISLITLISPFLSIAEEIMFKD